MASVSTDAAGNRRILFVDVDGSRKAIRLGKCPKNHAAKVKHRVANLLAAKLIGGIERDDAIWLAGEGAALRAKLEKVGLVPRGDSEPAKPTQTLSEFLTGYMDRHGPHKKPGTRAVWQQVINNLNELMPTGINLDAVTAGHAKEFHEKIKGRMAMSTVDKRIRFCRQFFADAVDWELIPNNPFAKVKTTTPSTKSNVSVPVEVIDRVLSACAPTWRIIVALSRYGGLRCPSEVLSLRWCDVDWDKCLLHIPEPKVEHHVGRGVRTCPIFAELRPYLEDAFELRTGPYVVEHDTYRQAANTEAGWKNANLRTQFLRILAKAGVAPWKRLFHSMRASRQTELERQFPLHVVCAWLGNTERIAKANYLLVTDADVEKAIAGAAQNPAQFSEKVTQNPAQHTPRTERAPSDKSRENIGENAISPRNSRLLKRRGQDSNTSSKESRNQLSGNELRQRAISDEALVTQNPAQLATIPESEVASLLERMSPEQIERWLQLGRNILG